jgi:hypothetical protein
MHQVRSQNCAGLQCAGLGKSPSAVEALDRQFLHDHMAGVSCIADGFFSDESIVP